MSALFLRTHRPRNSADGNLDEIDVAGDRDRGAAASAFDAAADVVSAVRSGDRGIVHANRTENEVALLFSSMESMKSFDCNITFVYCGQTSCTRQTILEADGTIEIAACACEKLVDQTTELTTDPELKHWPFL